MPGRNSLTGACKGRRCWWFHVRPTLRKAASYRLRRGILRVIQDFTMMISSSSCIVKKIGKGKRIYRLFMLFPWFFRCKGRENKLVPMDLGILKINVTIIMYWFNVNPFRRGFQSFPKETLFFSERKFGLWEGPLSKIYFSCHRRYTSFAVEDILHLLLKYYWLSFPDFTRHFLIDKLIR